MRPKESEINKNDLTRILPSYLIEEVEEPKKNIIENRTEYHSDKLILSKKVRLIKKLIYFFN